MYLSDVDLREALRSGQLIVMPLPEKEIGPTSIDLHLDSADQARVWDFDRLKEDNRARGMPPKELHAARITYGHMSRDYLTAPPREKDAQDALVFRRDESLVLRPQGFVLWQTREVVGTPLNDPRYICFIDGKSTRSRTGLIIHLTAPTVHAGWSGNLTLEMTNCGPFDLVLHTGDAIAQLTVAQITRPPEVDVRVYEATTFGQEDVTGALGD